MLATEIATTAANQLVSQAVVENVHLCITIMVLCYPTYFLSTSVQATWQQNIPQWNLSLLLTSCAFCLFTARLKTVSTSTEVVLREHW